MAKIVSGFLRQKCDWTQKRGGTNMYGEPTTSTALRIKCRWVTNSGWKQGMLGAGTGDIYDHIVTVDIGAAAGDSLFYTDPITGKLLGGTVGKVTTIVNAAGKEEGRICYV